jgi:2-polyprenyl-6-hydroxyphenyl methylase/3-demethylubiquinone-9 3-methyltransferase
MIQSNAGKNSRFESNYFLKSLYSKTAQDRPKVEFFLAQQVLRRAKKAKIVLDIGCGEGELLSIFSKLGLKVWGVDISSYAVKKAQKRLGKCIFQIDITKNKLPFDNDFFDIVCGVDIIEHLDNCDNLFREASRVLKEGGLLFLTTPNHGSIFGHIFGNFFPDDVTHINKHEERYWVEKLKTYGFSNVELKGIALYGFPPVGAVRDQFRKFKLPIIIQPILFPIRHFCGSLLIFARC